MKSAFATLCLIGSLVVAPISAHAEQITTSELKSFCSKNHPMCETYLLGALDGILQATKIDRTRLVCPQSDQTGAELKDYFLVASAMAGNGYDSDSAINMAMAAFGVAMPCK